jgi:hypothetical protein
MMLDCRLLMPAGHAVLAPAHQQMLDCRLLHAYRPFFAGTAPPNASLTAGCSMLAGLAVLTPGQLHVLITGALMIIHCSM